MIEIRPVEQRRDLRRFVTLPYDRYRHDATWVPPLRLQERERLDPGKNPFYDHADLQPFLAWRDGRVVGRVAAIDDRLHNEVHGDGLAAFGFLEADDEEAARGLLGAVEAWARARGRTRVRGPMSPSLNDVCGLLVEGFEHRPTVLMPYNPPAYGAWVESAGFLKVKDLYAWMVEPRTALATPVLKLAARFADRYHLRVRSLDRCRLAEELVAFRTIYNRAWERNWGFVAATEREFQHLGEDLNQIADPAFALAVEGETGVLGFAVALPDLNQVLPGTNGRLLPLGLYRLLTRARRIDQLRLALLGVLPEARPMGVFAVLLGELLQRVAQSRYRRVEASWVLEDNDDINRTAAAIGAVRDKTYRLYEKTLT